MAQRGDGTVDIRTFVLPTRHSPADEGVAQIVKANLVMGPTSNNVCAPTQLLKCPMNLPLVGACPEATTRIASSKMLPIVLMLPMGW